MTPRLQYLLDHYAEKASRHLLDSEQLILKPIEILEFMSKADPTRNKSATQWLLATYTRDGFKIEDISGGTTSKVYNTLAMFGLHRKKLPVEQRDLNHYIDLGSMWNAIKEFVVEDVVLTEKSLSGLSGKELRRAERAKAYQDSYILHEDEAGLKIVSPLTEFASKWWGRGTRWCTASDKNNYFAHYYEKAPLLIVVTPQGHKYQMSVTPEHFQFMDDDDTTVSRNMIVKEWQYFKPLFHYALNIRSEVIGRIDFRLGNLELLDTICQSPIEHKDAIAGFMLYWKDELEPEWYSKFLKNSGQLLTMVPKEILTKEMCMEAVRQNGLVIDKVPQQFIDGGMCDVAIANNGYALSYIPEAFLSPERCLSAIRQNGQALNSVPPSMITRELCLEAINGSASEIDHILDSVPEKYRDAEICRLTVLRHGENICYVPDGQMTRELCLLAVQKYPYVFTTSMMSQYQNEPDFIMEAVKSNGDILNAIPSHLRTPEVLYEAINSCPTALQYLSAGQITPELVSLALEKDGMALRTSSIWHTFSPACLQGFFKKAVSQNGRALDLIPVEDRNYEICQLAVQNNPGMLRAVPESILSAYPDLELYRDKIPRKWNMELLEDLKISISNVFQENLSTMTL